MRQVEIGVKTQGDVAALTRSQKPNQMKCDNMRSYSEILHKICMSSGFTVD